MGIPGSLGKVLNDVDLPRAFEAPLSCSLAYPNHGQRHRQVPQLALGTGMKTPKDKVLVRDRVVGLSNIPLNYIRFC